VRPFTDRTKFGIDCHRCKAHVNYAYMDEQDRPVCAACRKALQRAEQQDKAIAAKFDPTATPALPFNEGGQA
jgi:hypothetical protein